MTLHYIKVAFRNLLRHKVRNLITVFCLAVGIVCFSIVSYFIKQQLTSPLQELPHYEQMASTILLNNDRHYCSMTEEHATQIKNRHLPGVEYVAFLSLGMKTDFTFIDNQHNEKIVWGYAGEADSNYLSLMGYRSIYTSRTPSLNEKEVVLTESYAQKVFGQENPIGCKFKYHNESGAEEYFTISDVIPDILHSRDGENDMQFFVNYKGTFPDSDLQCFLLLDKGKAAKDAEAALNQTPIFSKDGKPMHFSVLRYAEQKINPARIFFNSLILLIGTLVLIAGVINFLKFTIQSFYNKMHELGLRKCLGASHWSLFQLLFYEICFMILAALVLSIVISEWIVPYMHSLVSKRYLSDIYVDLPDLLIMQSGIVMMVFLICCLIGALSILRIRRTHISQNIVGCNGSQKHVLRNLILGAQLLICMYFVGMSFGIIQKLNSIENTIYRPLSNDEYKQRLELNINSSYVYTHWEAIRSQIKQLPEVISTLDMAPSKSITYQKKNGTKLTGTSVNADSTYFSFFHIPMKGEKPQMSAEDVVYVSEYFEKILQQDSIQGSVILDDKSYRIAGVFKALPSEFVSGENLSFSVYFPKRPVNLFYMEIVPGTHAKVAKKVNEIAHQYIPETLEIGVESMFANLDEPYGIWDMIRKMAVILTAISFLITILGIYVAVSLDTERRQKEVAIRKINGATPRDIVILFGKLYVYLLIISFIVAMPIIHLTMHVFFQQKTFGHNMELGIIIFISVAGLVFATVGYKIYRIMRLNPVEVIKNE